MSDVFTPEQERRIAAMFDSRIKTTRHTNDDHLDRALIAKKINPGTSPGTLVSGSGDARWESRAAVTALPSTPYDGQVIYYQAASGVMWVFRYNAAGGTYKWKFVGGGDLTAEVLTQEAVPNSGTYGDPATPGPSITVPFAGNYAVAIGANIFSATASITVYAGVAVGATMPTDLQWLAASPNAAGRSTDAYSDAIPARRVTVSAASTALKMVYRANGAGGQALTRIMTVTPIAIG